MPLSRREFIEAGVISSAGFILDGKLKAQGTPNEFSGANPTMQGFVWPRQPDVRQELNFDEGWRFYRPSTNFPGGQIEKQVASDNSSTLDDTAWEQVNLPHTVRLEPLNASDGRNYQGVCWYRKHFPMKAEWQGKTIYLVFQGAMQVANLWLNGVPLPTHYGGYLPFTLDVTNTVRFGLDNVLSVRLDNSNNPEVPPGKPQNELDFVYFGGLYRSVQLRVMDTVFISDPILANKIGGGGIFVTFPVVNADMATVQVQTELVNQSSVRRRCTIQQELFSAEGAIAATGETSVELAIKSSSTMQQRMEVRQPQLWHPDRPHLYILHTSILENGTVVDDVYTRIGIRTIHFDKETGLHINGESFFSIGANRHQDHPYVGYALPASAHYKDAKKLREGGFNSYRSHYPQDPAFMDACDEMGILSIVSNPGWQFVGDDVFRRRVYQDAREMIRRDRNRPSVILWEAQLNETNNTSVAADLYRIVHEEYPGKDCYAAGDHIRQPVPGFAGWDVEYSYNDGSKPLWIREWGDQVDNWSDQQGSVRVSRAWGETPMLVQAANHLQALDRIYTHRNSPLSAGTARISGADLWAGIDAYRGYHYQPFYGGPLDLFRLPKFDYYFFQSQRPAELKILGVEGGPMVFIANFATHYSSMTLTVFSNCEQVRLSQNGKEIAVQSPDAGYSVPHAPFTFQVAQFSKLHSTLFANGIAKPGTQIGDVKAEGLIGGKVVARHEVLSPGVPTQLQLKVDDCGRELIADGSDWVRLYAYICDARGVTYPFGDAMVTFTVSGEGAMIEDARILANPMRAEAGIATGLLRATTRPGQITVQASAFGLKSAQVQLQSVKRMMAIWPDSL